jgi:hypothetical protein
MVITLGAWTAFSDPPPEVKRIKSNDSGFIAGSFGLPSVRRNNNPSIIPNI